MKKHCLLFSAFAALLFVLLSFNNCYAATDTTHPGFRVQGRFLYDNQGEKVTLYGINKMAIWTDIDGEPSFHEIAKTGANCVRITWNTSGTAEQLDTVIHNCRAEHMIPIVELHDATGEWSKLSSLVDYWTRPDIVKVIQKHQQYLLVNIGNEVGDTSVTDADFKSGYESAVSKMRTAGIHVPLLIDGTSWGQNIKILQSCGPDIISADPDKNVMFSVHMWWPYMYGHTDQEVVDSLKKSADMNLPLVVGEFGNEWDTTEAGQIPYKTIMENCAKNQIGYIAWEWGPGNKPQTFLDMTTDSTYATLHDWGLEVAVTSKYSVKNLAVRPISMLSNLPPEMPKEGLPAGNLALNKKAVASSLESTEYSADNIVDGDPNTRWASNTSDSNWVYVDLGEKKDINRVIINWETAYAAQYKIQVSDDATSWTDVYTQYSGKGQTEDISLKGSGRYVRIYGLQRVNSSYGYSIFELGVYGPDSDLSASISPDVATFDKAKENQKDVTVTLDSKANTLSSITNGDYVLKAGTDYTVDDNKLTIKKEYLSTLPVDTAKLTLNYSGGVNPNLLIAVGDTTPSPYVSPRTASFNSAANKQKDITVTMNQGNSSLTGITNGDYSLVSGKDYTVDGNNVTIAKEYLAKQQLGETDLSFNFDKADSFILKINVTDTTPCSTITPNKTAFEKRVPEDVAVTMALNGNTLSAIKNGDTILKADTDYTVDGNVVTIKKEYLAKQPVGTTKLTFDFSEGINPILNIDVKDTPQNSTITPYSTVFDSKAPKDIQVTMALKGNTLSAIKNGDATLTADTDYTVDGNVVTIKKEYLSKQSAKSLKLTFSFSEGKDQVLTIIPPATFKVESFNMITSSTSNSLAPRFKITNTSSSPLNLADVKIRYYFTLEGTEPQCFWCDWSPVGNSNVTGTFVKMDNPTATANYYLEIGFTTAAGTLAPNESIQVMTRFAKSDWTNYDQSNDYSFDASDNNYSTSNKITSYNGTTLNSGIEPQ
ncbi:MULTISPECIES: X2-like carbohydrate binding domain-containing protein [Clostridium]|uniref:X2-like carbohydrate binding domain-containing protein n=1 Tax=Clostridium TaxID=1485 RepID=UPI000824EB60|nr:MULTISPECIES: X2-like carbohydrate binding domain-containing protein [Clostridium]